MRRAGAPGVGFAGMGGLLRRGRSRISSPHSRTRTWRLARPEVRARRHRRERLRARADRPGSETPSPRAAAGPGAPWVGSPGWVGLAGVGGPASGAPQPHANMASRAPRSEGETPSPGGGCETGGQAGERDAITESGCGPGRAGAGWAGRRARAGGGRAGAGGPGNARGPAPGCPDAGPCRCWLLRPAGCSAQRASQPSRLLSRAGRLTRSRCPPRAAWRSPTSRPGCPGRSWWRW